MGDILHALPAVTALRQAHPSWHIGWVVEPRWQPLLKAGIEGTREQGNKNQAQGIKEHESGMAAGRDLSRPVRGSAMPIVDQLHFAAMRDWKRHPLSLRTANAIKTLRQELRAANYDAVLDFQGAIRSAAIGGMAGCKRRIGEAHPREWSAQWLFTERIVTRGVHVIEQDLELASAVAGDELAPAEPLLPIDLDAEGWCDSLLAPPTSGGAARPVALIAPGAGWGAKRWPPEGYAAVAQGLADRGMRVFVNAAPGEESLAAPIVAGGAATSVAATLPQLIALTRRISLCIAGDTGPLHLASALVRPVVGIYGPTDPARNGPYGTRARVLRSAGSRRDHSRRSDPDPGLLTITPNDVLRAADELLAEERAR
jgi:heptosyltransferase-1